MKLKDDVTLLTNVDKLVNIGRDFNLCLSKAN